MVRDKPTSIRLPPELLDEIDTLCQDEGCSRNDKITSLIEHALDPDDNQPEPIIKEVIKEVPKIEYRDKIVDKRVEVPKPYPVEKVVEKRVEVPKVIAPEYLPRYTCSQGCNHPNKNYTKRPKSKCRNCDQFNKLESGDCVWCGKDELEPISKDELNDLEIPLPNYYNNTESYKCPNSDHRCTAQTQTHSF